MKTPFVGGVTTCSLEKRLILVVMDKLTGKESDIVFPIWMPNYTSKEKQSIYSKVPYDESHTQAFFD